MLKRILAGIILCGVLYTMAARSEDWPTYLGNVTRSGVTPEKLPLPLQKKWVHTPGHGPCPAWPAPAKRDIWNKVRELSPTVTYDRAFHVVSAGASVYFGSSADDQVHCIDAETGAARWSFFTEGPVRLAPALADGRVYFGSDDGNVYCLNAGDGTLVWRFRPDCADRRIPGNGRVISSLPARTGVVVENGVATFLLGLFPPDDVYRVALNAETGAVIVCEKTADVSPQGYLVASPTRLFVPTGRTSPYAYDRQSLQPLGSIGGAGGAYAVLCDDGVASGPGRREVDTLGFGEPGKDETVASFPGIRMVVLGDMAYLQSKEELSALNRVRYLVLSRERAESLAILRETKKKRDKAFETLHFEELTGVKELLDTHEANVTRLTKEMDACFLWRKPIKSPYAMVLAGDTLFLGGEGEVTAYNAADGAQVWADTLPGAVYGLAVANGRLFASASDGGIHCYGPGEPGTVPAVAEEPVAMASDALDACRAAAARIIEKTGIRKGYCFVLDCGRGELALALAEQSELTIVGVERDPANVAAARASLDAAGLYGTRVSVHYVDGEKLPYTSQMANLVVSQQAVLAGTCGVPAGEVARLLRPYGGVAMIGGASGEAAAAALTAWSSGVQGVASGTETDGAAVYAVLRRGAVDGAGEWTQLYADASHTACSMDQVRGPMSVQWFGNPGPRDIIDRHHRPMSSLFKDGRLFVPADNLVLAIDPYNGTEQWRLDVPNSRRVGALKNSGHLLLAEDCLYVAVEGECWNVDPITGARKATFQAPQADGPRDWGYINRENDVLIGTVQKKGASFNDLSRDQVDLIEGDFRPVIVSDSLFAMDRHSGAVTWTWGRGGAIMNNAITIASGRIYFVESLNERSKACADGRLRIDYFCEGGTAIVALDLQTGALIWERPITLPFHHIMFLNTAEGVLLLTGSYNEEGKVFYGLFAAAAESGADLWHTAFQALDNRSEKFAETGGSHGEQWQHPVINQGIVYARPFAFNLKTGEKQEYIARRGGHGCGGLTSSAFYLYGRGSNPRMYPTETKETEGLPLTLVSRPGCWLNIIPAGGLIMIPESSSGCTCGYSMQTSIVLIPTGVAS